MVHGKFPRPRIGLSRCIEIDHCRYDGEMIRSELVRRLMEHADVVPVCPEMEIGLGVPRDPIIIVLDGGRRLVQPSTGRDLTEAMGSFTASFFERLGEVDGFVLKSRSPSCGVHDARICSELQDGSLVHGSGMFGREVVRRLGGIPVEDEARLRNTGQAEHFLTRAFTLRAFRELGRDAERSALLDFHRRNKLLLRAYSRIELGHLERILAGAAGDDLRTMHNRYSAHLRMALSRPPRRSNAAHVLMSVFDHVSEGLDRGEKELFLQYVELYRDARRSLGACTSLMRHLLERSGASHLTDQTIFEPFPREILPTAAPSPEALGSMQGREHTAKGRGPASRQDYRPVSRCI